MKDKDDEIIRTAAFMVIGVIVFPIVINTGINIINTTTNFVDYLGNRRAYNKRIRKGLKDGSIEIIDGIYYEKVDSVNES